MPAALRHLPAAAALLAVAAAALGHGLLTSRWQPSAALRRAADRVPQVPLALGDWRGEDVPVDREVYDQTRAEAYWMRLYRNGKTGQAVNVMLLCGPAGPMSVHTPDVCYRGAGYEMSGPPGRYTAAGGLTVPAELWTGDFAKPGRGSAERLRLFWSWSASGLWQAPDNPRFAFRTQPALYKLYVIRDLGPDDGPPEGDPAAGFLQDFLPALHAALFPEQ